MSELFYTDLFRHPHQRNLVLGPVGKLSDPGIHIIINVLVERVVFRADCPTNRRNEILFRFLEKLPRMEPLLVLILLAAPSLTKLEILFRGMQVVMTLTKNPNRSRSAGHSFPCKHLVSG